MNQAKVDMGVCRKAGNNEIGHPDGCPVLENTVWIEMYIFFCDKKNLWLAKISTESIIIRERIFKGGLRYYGT